MGASVLAVRVGESEVRDLQDVADKPSREHIFRGDSFNDLENIIDKVSQCGGMSLRTSLSQVKEVVNRTLSGTFLCLGTVYTMT